MKASSKTKSLVFIIVLLLITNIALMAFFIFKDKPDSRNTNREQGSMYQALKEDVGFSDKQLQQYQQMRKQNFESLKPHFGEVRKAKENFYELLYLPEATDSMLNAAADTISSRQKVLDLQMFAYLKKLRSTATEDQLPRFDSALKKTIVRMTGRVRKTKADRGK